MPAPLTVLAVDDTQVILHALKSMVSKRHLVHTASSGQEGIARYDDLKPDIVLLDINMPDMDGFAVLDHIRNVRGDRETFVVMLTADEVRELRPRALNLGANDFLFKPFDRTELNARIGVAERQIQLTRELKAQNRRINREMELVASLQTRLLPTCCAKDPRFRLESLYRPSGRAGGDYFDHILTPDGRLRVVVADVSGHGAGAAFFMAIVRTIFRLSAGEPLAALFSVLNAHLIEISGEACDFVTLFVADLDFAQGRLDYINAGHCPGLLKTAEAESIPLHPTSPLLGVMNLEPVVRGVDFFAGRELFLFTDGWYEWRLDSGDMFDLDGFLHVASLALGEETGFFEALNRRLYAVAGGEPPFRDDLTALWLKAEQPA